MLLYGDAVCLRARKRFLVGDGHHVTYVDSEVLFVELWTFGKPGTRQVIVMVLTYPNAWQVFAESLTTQRRKRSETRRVPVVTTCPVVTVYDFQLEVREQCFLNWSVTSTWKSVCLSFLLLGKNCCIAWSYCCVFLQHIIKPENFNLKFKFVCLTLPVQHTVPVSRWHGTFEL